jgi:hypothetical protein
MLPRDLRASHQSLCFNQLAVRGFKRWLPTIYALRDGVDIFPGHVIPPEDVEMEIRECEAWLTLREMEARQLSANLTFLARPRRA